MTGTLLAVILVLFLSWYLTRKLGRYTGQLGHSAGNLQVIDRISLGQNEALAIVRAGSQFLLLGISHAGIHTLCRLEEESISGWQMPEQTESGKDFREILAQITKGKKKDGK